MLYAKPLNWIDEEQHSYEEDFKNVISFDPGEKDLEFRYSVGGIYFSNLQEAKDWCQFEANKFVNKVAVNV